MANIIQKKSSVPYHFVALHTFAGALYAFNSRKYASCTISFFTATDVEKVRKALLDAMLLELFRAIIVNTILI